MSFSLDEELKQRNNFEAICSNTCNDIEKTVFVETAQKQEKDEREEEKDRKREI